MMDNKGLACALACSVLFWSLVTGTASAEHFNRPSKGNASTRTKLTNPRSDLGDFKAHLGISTWLSTGSTKWRQDASSVNPALGNPTSELKYQDLWSAVAQLDGELAHRSGLFGRARFGYGGIQGGTLTDKDFAAGQVLASQTESDVDDNFLWYAGVDAGYTFLGSWRTRGWLRAFVGYQHWEEKLVATGIRQEVSNPAACATIGVTCLPAGTISNPGESIITNTAKWNSIRIGLEGRFRFTRALHVSGAVAAIPYTSLDNDDIHHFRTELQQDPSFSMSGTGYGVNAEAGLTYRILRPLFVDVGYRLWWLRVTDGDWTVHPLATPPLTVNLDEFESHRHGVTVGLTLRF